MIRVLIVEDSAVVRELLAHVLGSDPDIRVVGAARDGQEALSAVEEKKPDVITMDINMPGMNGFEVTRRIMETRPTPIVVVSAIGDSEQVGMSFRAMESGAVAVLAKPHGGFSPEAAAESRELIRTVKLMSEVKVVKRWPQKAPLSPAVTQAPADNGLPRRKFEAVLIGASTGGPLPIRSILSSLPRRFPAAVLLVQHIAAGFGPGLVEWLAGSSRIPVQAGVDGERVEPGRAYVAPDGFHMGVREGPYIQLSTSEPENGLRPAVSYLFRSAEAVFGRKAIGILLSGMGRDGARELKSLRDAGAVTFVQDRESCAVFGMPGEAVRLGAAAHTLPPEKIAEAVASLACGSAGEEKICHE